MSSATGGVFISMGLTNTVSIDADGVNDRSVPFIRAVNSHGFVAVPRRGRPVCASTERFVRDARARWGIRHIRNARDRIEETRRTLGLTVTCVEAFAAEQEALVTPNRRWPISTGSSTSCGRHPDDRCAPATITAAALGRTAYAAERAITEYAGAKPCARRQPAQQISRRRHRRLLTLIRR